MSAVIYVQRTHAPITARLNHGDRNDADLPTDLLNDNNRQMTLDLLRFLLCGREGFGRSSVLCFKGSALLDRQLRKLFESLK